MEVIEGKGKKFDELQQVVREEHKSLLNDMQLWQGNFYMNSHKSQKKVLEVVDEMSADLA